MDACPPPPVAHAVPRPPRKGDAQARAQRLGLSAPPHLLGGDSDSFAVEKAVTNLPGGAGDDGAPAGASAPQYSTSELAMCNLCSIQGGFPLRTASVDVIICDLPFGKRCSSAQANQKLYAMALQEFGRLLRPGTGRCVLLTAWMLVVCYLWAMCMSTGQR